MKAIKANRRITSVLVTFLLLGAAPLWASDPVGIYAVVEKVVFEPNEANPQRIQVWGAFSISDGQRGEGYEAAQKGYVYFTLTPGKEQIVRKEWADLKAVAGTGQGIGFGFRYDRKTRIRKESEAPQSPDVYPTGTGVVKMGSTYNQPQIVADLKQALRRR